MIRLDCELPYTQGQAVYSLIVSAITAIKPNQVLAAAAARI